MHLPTRRLLVSWICQLEDDPQRVEMLRSGGDLIAQALADGMTNPAHRALFAQLLIQTADEGWLELDHPERELDHFGQEVAPSLRQLTDAHDIRSTQKGRDWVASSSAGVTFNLTNSPVGQLAGGDIRNVSILQVLDLAEAELDRLGGDPVEIEEGRSILRALAGKANDLSVGAGSGLAAAALARALGLG
jgi:hypothetical protein